MSWAINFKNVHLGLENGLRSQEKVRGQRLKVLAKSKDWKIKESHKIDKQDMLIFKLIGQGLHALGP